MFKARIIWRAIIAGVVAALAVSIVLALLGVALGFTVIDPMSDDPFSGLGIAFGFWSFLSIVVSLAVGGYIAGRFGGLRASEHGFLVWATVLLIGTMFGGLAVGSAAHMVGSAVQGIGSGVATVASGLGRGAMELTSGAAQALSDHIDMNFDTGQAADDVASVLRDTQIETLQPEYLRSQMRNARSELRSTVNQLLVNPDDYDRIITTFLDQQQARMDTVNVDVDRGAVVNALMSNRGMTRAEAEQAYDNSIRFYNQAAGQAKEALEDTRQQLEDTRAYIRSTTMHAREAAENFADAASKSALAAAAALIVGAIVACVAAVYGNNHAAKYYAVEVRE